MNPCVSCEERAISRPAQSPCPMCLAVRMVFPWMEVRFRTANGCRSRTVRGWISKVSANWRYTLGNDRMAKPLPRRRRSWRGRSKPQGRAPSRMRAHPPTGDAMRNCVDAMQKRIWPTWPQTESMRCATGSRSSRNRSPTKTTFRASRKRGKRTKRRGEPWRKLLVNMR